MERRRHAGPARSLAPSLGAGAGSGAPVRRLRQRRATRRAIRLHEAEARARLAHEARERAAATEQVAAIRRTLDEL